MDSEFNRDSVTTDDIIALRREAREAGDFEQAAICDRALSLDVEAWVLCEEVIEEAFYAAL